MGDSITGVTIAGRYIVDAQIGEGGSAYVYRGRDLSLNKKPVAIKIIKADAAAQRRFRDLFAAEADVVSQIASSFIVRFDDFGTHHLDESREVFFFVIELAKRDLSDAFRADRRAGRDASAAWLLHIARQVASALDAAHEAGFVHGDVKPGNVLLFDDADEPLPHAKLSDFGIARRLADFTQSTDAVFTPAYAPPEQWSGTLQPASDQYALACSVHEGLVGTTPFAAARDLRDAHAHQPPPRISEQSSGRLPARLDAAFAKALAKDHTDRHASCAQFIDVLRAALESPSPAGRRVRTDVLTAPPLPTPKRSLTARGPRVGPPTTPMPRPKRRASSTVLVGVLAALAVAVLVVAIRARDDSSPSTPATAADRAGPPKPAYDRAAMRVLQQRIVVPPTGCSETDFAEPPMHVRPAGLIAAYTCKTPARPGQGASFYQTFAARKDIEDAFQRLATPAGYRSGHAARVPCHGDDAAGPRSYGFGTGSYVCLTAVRTDGPQHWMIVSDVEAPFALVALMSHDTEESTVREWKRIRQRFLDGAVEFKRCDDSIEVKRDNTTCAYGSNVFYMYWKGDRPSSLSAYSPAGRKMLKAECAGGDVDDMIRCGAEDGGVVRFAVAAVSAYSDEAAAKYAEGHELGPDAKKGVLRECGRVQVGGAIAEADVSERNSTCARAEEFVRDHQEELCSAEMVAGWRLTQTGDLENITTLRKGSSTIQTDACSR